MIAETVNLKEIIGGRYDNSYVLFHHRLLSYKYPSSPLQKFLIDKPQYGANEASISRESNEIPRYIRITDIDENGSLADNFGATAKKLESKYILKNNDILIARSGNTVGKSYIHKTETVNETCYFAGYLIKFVIDSNLILPDYVFIFTKLSVFTNWVKVTQRVTGQPNINAEEYSNLPIPVPPIEIQRKIIEIYQNAQKARLKKTNEAKRLLNSIDDYILDALQVDGVKNPGKGNSFRVSISDVIGSRLDVSYYKDKFEMASSKYDNTKLYNIVDIDPKISFIGGNADDVISFIPMECIDEISGEIINRREITIGKSKGYTKFEENDLLWAKITPCMQNGKSAIARGLKNGVGCGSTEFYVIRPKDGNKVLIDYVYLILRHHDILFAAQTSFGGSAGQQRVPKQYLKSITIPIPDISVQKEIVDTVYSIKAKAKQLQENGNLLLEEAKLKIENIILG